MPIQLSALTADRRTINVAFGEESLTLTYRPSSVNAVQEARELEERAAGKHLLAQARSLAEIIVGWDATDDDGQPVAPTVELISTFGLDTVSKLTRAVLDDLLPNRVTAAASPSGSRAAENSAAAQAGI
jgi:hypothetical protein